MTRPRAWAPAGSQPQFQHSENWPSIFSPQFLQTQPFLTDDSGAKVFLRIALALTTVSSSTTQSSGQHSVGGSWPAALIRSIFFITHLMPNVARTFFKWLIISGSLDVWMRFIELAKFLVRAPQGFFVEFQTFAQPKRPLHVITVAIAGGRMNQHRQAFAVEHQPWHDLGELIVGEQRLLHGVEMRPHRFVMPDAQLDVELR